MSPLIFLYSSRLRDLRGAPTGSLSSLIADMGRESMRTRTSEDDDERMDMFILKRDNVLIGFAGCQCFLDIVLVTPGGMIYIISSL